MQFLNKTMLRTDIWKNYIWQKEKTKTSVLLETNQPVPQCLVKKKKKILKELPNKILKSSQYTK